MLKIFSPDWRIQQLRFLFPLRSVKQKLEQVLLDIGFKDKDAANLHVQRMPTGRYLTGRSGHLLDTLVTPKLHQLPLQNWQPPSQELKYSTSFRPSLQSMALDMPRKESARSVTNPDNGPKNVQRTRVKAGMEMEMKEQRTSSLGDPLLLHLGPPCQASQQKGLQLVRKMQQAMDHYPHHGNVHWQQERCHGMHGGGSAIKNVSLAFDPLVWTTENELTPSVADALYVLHTTMTRKFPVLFILLTYVTAIFSAPFAKTIWNFSVPFAKTFYVHCGKRAIHNGAFCCRQLDPSS